jgi:hypothetical protein
MRWKPGPNFWGLVRSPQARFPACLITSSERALSFLPFAFATSADRRHSRNESAQRCSGRLFEWPQFPGFLCLLSTMTKFEFLSQVKFFPPCIKTDPNPSKSARTRPNRPPLYAPRNEKSKKTLVHSGQCFRGFNGFG